MTSRLPNFHDLHFRGCDFKVARFPVNGQDSYIIRIDFEGKWYEVLMPYPGWGKLVNAMYTVKYQLENPKKYAKLAKDEQKKNRKAKQKEMLQKLRQGNAKTEKL